MAHLIASESATADELRNLCVNVEPRGWTNVGEPVDWPRRAVGWPKAADPWAAFRAEGCGKLRLALLSLRGTWSSSSARPTRAAASPG